jgi:hypothetical protein
MRRLVISLAVLVAALVAADRIAVTVAENKISDRVAASYQLTAKPNVTIQGFPFLTQVLTGDYPQVDVSVSRIAVGSIGLVQLRAQLDGVHASLAQLLRGGISAVTADRATGSAVIPYPELAGWLPHGVRLSRAGPDVRVSGSVQVLGTQVPLSGTASPSVTGDGIKVVPHGLTVGAGTGLPAGALASRLGVVIPLTDLPLHLRIASIAVTGTGLRAGASARDIQFTSGA